MRRFEEFRLDVVKKINSSMLFQKFPECAELFEGESEDSLNGLIFNSSLVVGGNPKFAVPVAAACLFLNKAADLIDKVQDAPVSSGTAVENHALAMIFAAYDFLSDVRSSYTNQVLHLFSECAVNSVLGQSKGFVLENTSPSKALEHYWSVTILKSGSLLRMAAAGGAAAVTHDQKLITAISDYGIAFGTILQVLDDCRDVLDEQGTYEASLPVILHSLARNDQILTFPPVQTRDELLKTLRKTGTLQTISNVLLYWEKRGLESLAIFGACDSADALKDILINAARKGEGFMQVEL